jgi:hypothetical protein
MSARMAYAHRHTWGVQTFSRHTHTHTHTHTYTHTHTAYFGREILKALIRAGMVSSGFRSANLKCEGFTGRCAIAPVSVCEGECASPSVERSFISGNCSRTLPRSVPRRDENEICTRGGGLKGGWEVGRMGGWAGAWMGGHGQGVVSDIGRGEHAQPVPEREGRT